MIPFEGNELWGNCLSLNEIQDKGHVLDMSIEIDFTARPFSFFPFSLFTAIQRTDAKDVPSFTHNYCGWG